MNRELLGKLKWGSTWALLGLNIVTLAVYGVFYAYRQSRVLNELASPDRCIGMGYFVLWFPVTFVGLALLFVSFFLPDDSAWVTISDLSNRFDSLLGIIWAFRARRRMIEFLPLQEHTDGWPSGILTFFFTQLYLNYKINKLTSFSVDPSLPSDAAKIQPM